MGHQFIKVKMSKLLGMAIRKCIRPYLWKYEFRNGCLLNLEGDTEAQSHLKAIRHEAHI